MMKFTRTKTMSQSSTIGLLTSVLALGMSIPSAFAQDGYYRAAPNQGAYPYGGYNMPALTNGDGYGNIPSQPYPPFANNPQAGPYPNGYNLPALPNGGGNGNVTAQPYIPFANNPQAGPYPNGYRANPLQPNYTNGGGYPASPSTLYPGRNGAYLNPPVNPYVSGGYQGYQSN
jgi:hypothetical protein